MNETVESSHIGEKLILFCGVPGRTTTMAVILEKWVDFLRIIIANLSFVGWVLFDMCHLL